MIHSQKKELALIRKHWRTHMCMKWRLLFGEMVFCRRRRLLEEPMIELLPTLPNKAADLSIECPCSDWHGNICTAAKISQIIREILAIHVNQYFRLSWKQGTPCDLVGYGKRGECYAGYRDKHCGSQWVRANMRMKNNRFTVASGYFMLIVMEILLSRRFQTGYETENCLPAGHIEDNEHWLRYLPRNTRRNRCQLTPQDLKLVHVMHRKHLTYAWIFLRHR
jgi:hypothetical protein